MPDRPRHASELTDPFDAGSAAVAAAERAEQTPKNCHYVSQCFTRPWEVENRQLVFFDFAKGDVRKLSSKRLLSKLHLNTEATERRLRDLIETPFSSARARVRKQGGSGDAFTEPLLQRAVRLALMLQAQRLAEARDDLQLGASSLSLESFLSKSDDEIESFVVDDDRKRHLLWIPTPGCLLSFPSTGICALPVVDDGVSCGFSFACAMPFDLQGYVALAPLTAQPRLDRRCSEKPELFSLGTSRYASQVILPPTYEQPLKKDAVEFVRNARRAVLEVIVAMECIQDLHRDALRTAGTA